MGPSDQQTCPHTLGLIVAVVIFFVCIGVGVYIHIIDSKKFENQETDEYGNIPDRPNLGNTMMAAFICGLLVAVIAYFVTKFLFNVTVSQNEAMVKNYMENMGMSRAQAQERLSATRENQNLAAAFRDGNRRY
tara:strand:- start:180 stop:578 length:399 start_codon:yes stop_codon:yes gene_type:complete